MMKNDIKKGILFLLLFAFGTDLKISTHTLDTEYSKEFTDLLEAVYGPAYLSQGGNESLDHVFENQNLDGKKLLDIGSGLGGADFYLAQKYKVDIIGIDCVSRLVDEANRRKIEHKLIGTVMFVHQEPDNFSYSYAPSSFDIIFAKESLLHISDKSTLLKELFRLLKPGGQLIILDWLVKSHELESNIKAMMEMDGLNLNMATLSEYKNYLHHAGFEQINTSFLNEQYSTYTNDNLKRIKDMKTEFIHLFGEQNFEYSLKTWALQKKIFEGHEVLVTSLKAIKS